MHYSQIQIMEVIEGKLIPIDHPWNKDERTEDIMADIPADKLAKVKYGIGMTLNIGNYQSAKVDIGVELPCHVDDLQAKYEEAVDFSNEKLVEEVGTLNQLKKTFGGK